MGRKLSKRERNKVQVNSFRVMDVAWLRDRAGVIHTGEALMLACLIQSKKTRKYNLEEELKDVLGVFEENA